MVHSDMLELQSIVVIENMMKQKGKDINIKNGIMTITIMNIL